jgi:hypothetical protein
MDGTGTDTSPQLIWTAYDTLNIVPGTDNNGCAYSSFSLQSITLYIEGRSDEGPVDLSCLDTDGQSHNVFYPVESSGTVVDVNSQFGVLQYTGCSVIIFPDFPPFVQAIDDIVLQ